MVRIGEKGVASKLFAAAAAATLALTLAATGSITYNLLRTFTAA